MVDIPGIGIGARVHQDVHDFGRLSEVEGELSVSATFMDGARIVLEDLAKIFKPASKTHFDLLTTDTIRGRRALVYEYSINIENNKDGGVGLKGAKGVVVDSAPAGEKGRLWIDRENHRVLRIEYQLTDIAPTFAVKAVTKSIDYDMVEIAGEKYLLPIVSDFRGTVQGPDSKRYESRNLIRFRNYQKYGTDVIAVDEDSEPAVEEKPN